MNREFLITGLAELGETFKMSRCMLTFSRFAAAYSVWPAEGWNNVCICFLHNFLLLNQESCTTYLQLENDESLDLPENIYRFAQQGSNRSSFDAYKLRNDLCLYFNSEHGSLAWQQERATEYELRDCFVDTIIVCRFF